MAIASLGGILILFISFSLYTQESRIARFFLPRKETWKGGHFIMIFFFFLGADLFYNDQLVFVISD